MSAAALTPSERGLDRTRSERWTPALATLLGLVLLAATVEVVLDGAAGHTGVIPKQPAIAGWMSGIGHRLGFRTFLVALLVSCAAYAGLLALARGRALARLWRRPALILIAALHVVVLAGPILLSTDVFSYIAYARMGVEHGLNPYLNGPAAIAHDPIFRYVGQDWRHVASAYGPVYTLLSYPLAPLGVHGALWAMKLAAFLSSAGVLALTWRCARDRGIDPTTAVLLVGANPLYVLYGLGGAHNDLLMMLLMMLAVSLTPLGAPGTRAAGGGEQADAGTGGPAGAGKLDAGRREALGAATIVVGALVKATVAALLPFMILSRRRVAPVLGALVALVGCALVGYLAFGIHGIDVVAALNRDAAFVSSDSFATEIAHLFGKPGVFPVDHDLLKAALVAIVVHLMWRTWRGYDWVAASGWTLLAISVTSTWLLAWYILWPLPLAVISRDRRLLIATLAIQLLFVAHQLAPLVAPVE